jgi:hypothetical protein
MIRVIYEPRIPSTYIKDEVWYPEINRKMDEYYGYLYHEAGRTNGLIVITYSSVILNCLEVISKERKIKMEVEMNGNIYTDNLEDCYRLTAMVMQNMDHKMWKLEDNE